jgi:type II secretory pathway pseudopilin PulG
MINVKVEAAFPIQHLTFNIRRSGFSLMEAVVSILIVSILLVVALTAVGASKAGQLKIADRIRGERLALDLMNEILQQAYYEPDDPPRFGLEGVESATSRALYDDVDDYAGWSESPPQYKNGTPMAGFDGWTRSVAVDWVDPNNLKETSAIATDVKRMTVTVSRGDLTVARLSAIRTAAWKGTLPQMVGAGSNRAPTAIALATPSTVKVGTPVTFDGRPSVDPNGDPLSYAWTFGDGLSGSGATAAHAYAAKGVYTATLAVNDGRGGWDTDWVTITVTP